MWLLLILFVAGVCFWLADGRFDVAEGEVLAIAATVYVIAKWGNGGGR